MESDGRLSSRPVFKPGEMLTGSTQARSNYRASPFLRRTIKCPVSVPSVEASTSGHALASLNMAGNG